ncbi:MAG: TonB-dependent receptor [Bacteroidetes bacterium]|nr:TonB-dependent receptor [Bacteroidota bacterium]
MKHTFNGCIRYVLYSAITVIAVISVNLNVSAQFSLSGTVSDQITGMSLAGAHISSGNKFQQAVSDADGSFRILNMKEGAYELKVSFVGYSTLTQMLVIHHDTTIQLKLNGAALLGEEVNIIATRAQEKYPTAYSSISNKDIKAMNLGKDIPYLILQSPSVIVTSDAGNGIGYTGINIRGTDLTRINVTVNSIPLNDPESQIVFFVDLPDIASSTADIQIQRGVGTSTNGAGAFGASINFLTSDLHQDAYGELDLSGGSYNTFKSTLRFGTGLMAGKFCIDGRLSFIRSDGYIDRASSNLKSYYLAGGYYGKNTTVKLITYSGLERTYQAWNGVPKDSLATNRTYNPSGEYSDQNGNIAYYKDQVDNYQQDNYQLIVSQALTKNWNINGAAHYTKGKGYYENYEQNESFSDYGLDNVIIGNDTIISTDLINRKIMDNDFYGITFSSNFTIPDKLKLSIGGAWNSYYGRHFGKVIWAEFASNGDNNRNWYYNTGLKKDFNVYAKVNYRFFKKLNIFADIQYRRVSYKMEGTLDNLRTLDQQHLFNFFNPKAGLFLSINKSADLYFSFGVANREPTRNNYKDSDPGKEPTNETLYDYELGYSLRLPMLTLGVNFYLMDYRNQLVLTGEINNVGEAVMVNVPHSFREGLELSAALELFQKKLLWNVTATFSRNKISDFIQYIDLYDVAWNYIGQQSISLGKTNLSFSPGIIAGSVIAYKPIPQLSIGFNSKYVGKQYIDNSSNNDRSLDGYFVNGLSAMYSVKTKLVEEIGFTLAVNNLFSVKYETNGWVYPYIQDGNYYEANGYFPQALINFLFGISVKI